jgi:hypothetical protein
MEELKHHIILNEIIEENNRTRRHYWKIYPDEQWMTKNEDKTIFALLLSNSLEDKLIECAKSLKDEIASTFIRQIIHIKNRKYYTQDDDRHFTINSKNQMTFTPKGKMTKINDSGNWSIEDRQIVRYGKGLRKILENPVYEVSDSDIEQIQNQLRAHYEFTGKFEIVDGRQIQKYYHYETYARNTASLGNSCMKHSECQDYLHIYVNNPDKIRMLIAKNDKNLIIGRALLWKPDNLNQESNDDNWVMDRIYGNDITIDAFKEYATDNSIPYKPHQSHSEPETFVNIPDNFPSTLYVKVNIEDIEYYPYMDTFKYTDDHMGSDNITLNNSGEGKTVFDQTSGDYTSEDNQVEDYYGHYIDRDEAVFSEYHDCYIHEENAVYSEYHQSYLADEEAVQVNDRWYHPDANVIVWSDYEQEHLLEDEAVYCEEINDYVLYENTRETITGQSCPINEAKEIKLKATELSERYSIEKDIVIKICDRFDGVQVINNDEDHHIYFYHEYDEDTDALEYFYNKLEKIIENEESTVE